MNCRACKSEPPMDGAFLCSKCKKRNRWFILKSNSIEKFFRYTESERKNLTIREYLNKNDLQQVVSLQVLSHNLISKYKQPKSIDLTEKLWKLSRAECMVSYFEDDPD